MVLFAAGLAVAFLSDCFGCSGASRTEAEIRNPLEVRGPGESGRISVVAESEGLREGGAAIESVKPRRNEKIECRGETCVRP
jgi:hypothetical protein